MKRGQTTVDLETLLLHEPWVQRLARALVRDEDEAEDMVQEARIAFWRRPPTQIGKARSWLGTVVRNRARNRARDGQRRTTALSREVGVTEAPPSPETVTERLDLHRRLAELVAALDEPYRQALVMRHYEGLSAAEIARRLEIPAGTVRWRIKTALDRLRARLDEQHGGQRARWLAVFGPLAARSEMPKPGASFVRATLLPVGAAGALVAAIAAGAFRGPPAGPPASERPAGSAAAAAVGSHEPPSRGDDGKVSALLGLVLPTLAAASVNLQPLSEDEAVAACVEFKAVAVRCKEEPGDHSEVVEEGSGPIAPRRARCKQNVEYKTFTRGEREQMERCGAVVDCAAFLECAVPLFDKLIGRPPVTFDRARTIAQRTSPGALEVSVDEAVVDALNRLVGSREARHQTGRALDRMRTHETLVGEVLEGYGLSRELAAVALLESGFDDTVVSGRAAATGLWQLTKRAAEAHGLVVAGGRDERLDARRATEAAAGILADLHRRFADWNLALAAYHVGPQALSHAIALGGTRDVAELQSRGLIPPYRAGVMAAVLVLRDPALAR